MKLTPLSLLTLCILAANASASIEVTAELINSTEKKEAPADSSSEDKKPAPQGGTAPAAGAAKPITQEKALKLTVHNASGKPEPGLTVRYWFISRDMKTLKPALLDGGESSADLKPNGTTVVVSDPVKASYTQRQTFMPKAGGGANAPAPKPVEAGGTKVVGTGAQVIKGGKVVAEYFSEAAYKQLVGSSGKNPGPLYKAPKPEETAQ